VINCYSEACGKITAYRSAYAGKKKGFLLKMTDIADLISAYGNNLDGIRFYFGLDNSGDIEVFYLGTVKDSNGDFNDVNVTSATGKWRPCPLMCDNSGSPFA
jgi:hypothetical protein